MGRGAGAAIALVVGAVEMLDLRIALIEVKVKVAAAVSADQQAGKHISKRLATSQTFMSKEETNDGAEEINGIN